MSAIRPRIIVAPLNTELPLLCLIACLLAGCASYTSMARDRFVAHYSCPSAIAAEVASSANGGHVTVNVTGCGYTAKFTCTDDAALMQEGPNGDLRAVRGRDCGEDLHCSYDATDGSHRVAWWDAEIKSQFPVAKQAAIASAAHDLPCESASIVVVGSDEHGYPNMLEGCGQRITYQVVDVPTPPGRIAPAPYPVDHRYMVVGRIPIPGAIAPGGRP